MISYHVLQKILFPIECRAALGAGELPRAPRLCNVGRYFTIYMFSTQVTKVLRVTPFAAPGSPLHAMIIELVSAAEDFEAGEVTDEPGLDAVAMEAVLVATQTSCGHHSTALVAYHLFLRYF